MWAIVGLGLGYMTPMTVFDTFGIVSGETNAVVPLAYLAALVAMIFTAISYGRMTRVYPSAGSAYTYASETIHPNFGFLVGWSSLLDYLLLPMVNAVIGRIYFESFFPEAPSWVFVLVYVGVITAFNFLSMKGTSRVNGILVVFQVVLIATFVVLAWLALKDGMGEGTIFTLNPLYHAGVEVGAVLAGATVVCFSFIGFDAITMYSEEAKTPDTVPKAIVYALLIGGAIFFDRGMVRPSRVPDPRRLRGHRRHASRDGAVRGRRVLQDLVHLGRARRRGRLEPLVACQRVPHDLRHGPQRQGPRPAVPVVHPPEVPDPDARRPHRRRGIAAGRQVHPRVHLGDDQLRCPHRVHGREPDSHRLLRVPIEAEDTPKEIFRNIVLPFIGMCLTGVLWVNLHADALLYGTIWLAIGIILLFFMTRFFRTPLTMKIEEETLAEEGTPVPHIKHGGE